MAKNMLSLRLPHDIGRGKAKGMRRSGKRQLTTRKPYKRLQAIYQEERRNGGRTSSGGGPGGFIKTRADSLPLRNTGP